MADFWDLPIATHFLLPNLPHFCAAIALVANALKPTHKITVKTRMLLIALPPQNTATRKSVLTMKGYQYS
ncbi:MAG: hypothetical protein ABFS30_06240 [Pseudomonadota bacterium]